MLDRGPFGVVDRVEGVELGKVHGPARGEVGGDVGREAAGNGGCCHVHSCRSFQLTPRQVFSRISPSRMRDLMVGTAALSFSATSR